MLTKIIGYAVVGLGLIGVAFFGYYHGNIILLPRLWFGLSIVLLFLGFYLVAYSKYKKRKNVIDKNLDEQEQLKKRSRKIIVNIDRCEFKKNNFQQEISDMDTTADEMVEASIVSEDVYPMMDISQVVVVYKHQLNSKIEKFVSHVFAIDEVTLKFYIMNNKMTLYVDRMDSKHYFFELNN
jgi:hypothetical protein